VNVELEHSRSYLQREMAAAEARIHTLQTRLQDDDNVSQVKNQDRLARMLVNFHSLCIAGCSFAIRGLLYLLHTDVCWLSLSQHSLFSADLSKIGAEGFSDESGKRRSGFCKPPEVAQAGTLKKLLFCALKTSKSCAERSTSPRTIVPLSFERSNSFWLKWLLHNQMAW
jgi:hypothetical protein